MYLSEQRELKPLGWLVAHRGREALCVENARIAVLVVEDEPLIQELISDALRDGGFEPKFAANGTDALAALQTDGAAFRALITDINFPGGLTGWDVAKRARELTSDIPVIYITGRAAVEWAANGVPNSVLIGKPFAPAQLVTALATLLNSSPPAKTE